MIDTEFDSAERAVLFSSPGGSPRTTAREVPGVHHYLAHLPTAIEQCHAPLHKLVDCLNCEMGCNGCPATMNHNKHLDEVEGAIEKRSREARDAYARKRSIGPAKWRRRRLTHRISKH